MQSDVELDSQAPSIPEGFLDRLREVRSSFYVKWNRQAVIEKKGRYDAAGRRVPPVFGGRWEIWDQPETSEAYKLMVVRGPGEEYRPLSGALIQRLQRLNPEHYDGDLNKLWAAVTEDEELRAQAHERDGDEFLEAVAEWAYWCQLPKQRVIADIE